MEYSTDKYMSKFGRYSWYRSVTLFLYLTSQQVCHSLRCFTERSTACLVLSYWERYRGLKFAYFRSYQTIIIIFFITFIHGIYNYLPETHHVSRVYSVAATL